MSEGADSGTVQISEDSCKSTKNDGEHDATAATTTPSSSSLSPTPPSSTPPSSTPPSQPQLSTTTSTGRRPRFGTGGPPPSPYMWIDGRQLRSALAWTKKSLPRRVSFPSSDTHLVTGYLEPANPWRHAENVNHEDLIFAYKESCARHNTEPLQNVLVQLENLDISQDRCAELSLKGEILNQDKSESLEEILKRVQFKKINLEGTSLNEESATILFDMLEYYESTKYLNISSNPEIGVRGWQACSHMIKKTQCLEQLEARDIMFNEQNMNILSRALRLVSHLHVLKLENCGLSGRAIVSLVTALKMNSGIRELYLADNGLNFHDAIQLGSLLRMNNHLQLLDISNNNVQDDGVRDILEGLINQVNEDKTGKGLSILILWNNRLTKKSSSYFSRIIALSKTLETLNIGQNMLTDETLSTVNESLKKNRVLLQLGMQSTELTCDGIITLADIMETNQVLQRIDLRDNTIQMRGMNALVNVMKKNKTITQIDLDDKPRIKIDGPIHEYTSMVAEIRSCCSRNEERRLLEESTEDAESPQNANSRKISLTCQTLPTPPSRSATSLVADEPTARAMLEPKRTSGGRLRSPAPSPIPSPVASPIPSPSRNRFVVCRVPEASLRSTDSSASSSPVTPPSLGSSPCFFHNANSGSSRFRVSVVESTEGRSSPQSVVASSSGSSITIGFNVTVHANDSDNVDSSSNTAIKPDSNDTAVSVNTFNVVSVAEKTSSQNVTKNEDCCEKKSINEKTQSDERVDATMLPKTDEIVTCENKRYQETGKKEEISARNNVIGTLQSGRENITANCENFRNNMTNQSNVTKDLVSVATIDESTEAIEDDCITYTSTKELQVPAYPNKDTTLTKITVLEDETRNSGRISPLNEESELCLDQRQTSGKLSCVEESSKTSTTSETSLARATESNTQEQVSTSVQKHKSNLEKLLSLFQHPGHLFSNDAADTRSSLQENVSSVMTLGDKLQQYLKETRAKVSTDNSSWYSSEHESPSKSKSMKLNVQQLQNLTGIFASFKIEPHASFVEHSTKLLGQIKNQGANMKEKDYERSTRIDVAKVDENLLFDQEKNQIVRNNGANNNDTEKSQITKNDESNLFDEERNQIKRNDEKDLVSVEGNKIVRNDENNLADQKHNQQVLNNEKNLIDQAGIQIERIDEKDLENQKKKQTDENVNESFDEIEDKNQIVREITESEDLRGGRQNKIATDDLNNWERVSAEHNQDSEDCKEIRLRKNNKYSINMQNVNVSEDVCSVNNLQCTQFNLSNRPLPDSVQSKDNFADNVVLDGGCIATNAASSFISEDTYKSVACIDIKLANKYKYKHCALELSKTDKAGCKNARCCENSVSDDEDKGERNSTQDSKLVEHNDAERLKRDNSEILDNNDNATCSERNDTIGEANVLTVKRTCDTSTDSINQTSDSSFLIYNIAHDRKAVNNSVSIASTSTCATADDDAMIQSTPDKSETSSVDDVETLSTALKDVDVNDHLKEEITSNTCRDQNQRCDFTTTEGTREGPAEILDDACRDTRHRRSTSVNIKIKPHESALTSPDIQETLERHCERQTNMPNNVNIHRTKEAIETVDYPENSTDDDKRIDPTILVTPYEASATLNRSDAEELIFCMTDISTDGTSIEDELSPSITSRNSPNDVAKAAESFFELPALRTTSTATLLIENPEDMHRNSQDSGIEEAILTIVDAVETVDAHPLPLPRSSLQESVDSGIESECSSLCVKVESAAERTSESVAISKKTSRDYNTARDRDDDDAGDNDDDDDDDEDNDDGGDDNDVNNEFEEFTSDFLAREARLVDNVNDDIAHSYLNSIKYTVVNTTRSVADIASSAPLGVAATADEDNVAHSATSVVAHSPTTVHDTSPK